MTTTGRVLSTADARRGAVVVAALSSFAQTGFWATPVADVASAAGISPAYVFRLFPTKRELFVAALEHCYDRIVDTLSTAADEAADLGAGEALAHLGDAYARLISDRDLLMLQVHALSASDVPEITGAVQRGCAQVVALVKDRTGAPDAAVQQFMAYGQLCHLIVAAGLQPLSAPWARLLTDGMAHPEAPAPS